jgi:hypothetical protein
MPATTTNSFAWLPANFNRHHTTSTGLKAMFVETGSQSDNARDRRPVGRANWVPLTFACFLIAPVVLAVGCGDSDKRVPVFPVSGKVTYQGQAPVGAQVVLYPVNNWAASGVAPTGIVLDDGSFKITAYDPDDGAPQGDYVATIQWFKITKEAGGPGPNVIPKKYTNPKTSPIKVSVASSGSTEIPTITIASK